MKVKIKSDICIFCKVEAVVNPDVCFQTRQRVNKAFLEGHAVTRRYPFSGKPAVPGRRQECWVFRSPGAFNE